MISVPTTKYFGMKHDKFDTDGFEGVGYNDLSSQVAISDHGA